MTKYHVFGTRGGQEVLLATCINEAIAFASLRGCDGWENLRIESTEKRKNQLVSCTVSSTSGVDVLIAVKADKQSTAQDNASDLRTVAQIVTRLPAGAIRLRDVRVIKSVAGWNVAQGCTANGDPWGWYKSLA